MGDCIFEGLVDGFEAYLKANLGLSEHTLKAYRTDVLDCLVYLQEHGIRALDEITTDDLRLYLDSYQSNRTAGKTTIDNIRRILSSFFAWLEDEDFFVSFHPLSSFLLCTIICWAGVRIQLLHFPVEGIEKQAFRDHDRSIGSTCFFFVLYFLKCRATTSFLK